MRFLMNAQEIESYYDTVSWIKKIVGEGKNKPVNRQEVQSEL